MPALRKPLTDWARTPEQEESYQRMLAKCQKNAHPKVEIAGSSGDVQPQSNGEGSATNVPDAVPTPSAPSAAALVWNRQSKYVMISGCGQFQILKEVIGNVSRGGVNYSNGRTVYQCWRRVQYLWYIKFEPRQVTFEAAKEVCEAYAAAHPIGALQAG